MPRGNRCLYRCCLEPGPRRPEGPHSGRIVPVRLSHYRQHSNNNPEPISHSNLYKSYEHASRADETIIKSESSQYRPGVHEASLTQPVGVVRRRLRAQNAAHGASPARALAAALALNPNQHFTFLLPTHT